MNTDEHLHSPIHKSVGKDPPLPPPRVVKVERVDEFFIYNCDVYIGGKAVVDGSVLCESEWKTPFEERGEDALSLYEAYLREKRPDLMKKIPGLSGRNLGCFCHPERCHGDVLVKLYNEIQAQE